MLSKFENSDKSQCFRQWKRGAFFMKTCELIYNYRYKEEEHNTLKNCFREWRRVLKHLRNKDYQYDSLRINHNYHCVRELFTKWKTYDRVRGKILSMKLSGMLLSRY
jgi:hypothetical protein